MDQVRAFLRVLWVQRFWVLSVVGVLAAAVCWMLASGKLQAEYAADKSAILAKFGEMDAIKNKPFHGNDAVNTKEREEAGKIAANVKSLWQKLYENQREQVLFWPEQLGKDFLEYIDKRKFDQAISPEMRDRYLNYISTRFDALVDIVKAQKAPAGAVGGAGMEGGRFEMAAGAPAPMPGDPNYSQDYLVQWLDQDALRAKLSFGRQPTAREVWVRQEDLWVYEILLRVIANTNKERGATRPDNTAIRVIESLQVGAEAATANAMQPQIVIAVPGAPADGGMGMEGGGMEGGGLEGRGMGMEGGGMEMGMEGGMGDGTNVDATILVNRYVDAEGKPLADASAGAGVEFRRLPIRMRLQMDQGYIPQVLVECANAALPIEVQRVRINPEKSGADFAAGGAIGGGYAGGYRGGEGGMEMGSYAQPGAVPSDFVTVEIQGLVYVYNAPDPAVLTVPGGEENLAATDAAVVR